MFDKQDARLLGKVAVGAALGSSLVVTVAAVAGLALRVFGLAAG